MSTHRRQLRATVATEISIYFFLFAFHCGSYLFVELRVLPIFVDASFIIGENDPSRTMHCSRQSHRRCGVPMLQPSMQEPDLGKSTCASHYSMRARPTTSTGLLLFGARDMDERGDSPSDEKVDAAVEQIEVESYGKTFLVNKPKIDEIYPEIDENLGVSFEFDPDGIVDLDVDEDEELIEEFYWDEAEMQDVDNKEYTMEHVLQSTVAQSPEQVPTCNITLDTLDLLSKSSNIAYFYLKNELGLPEESMWKITYEAGSVLGMTTENLKEKIDLLQRTMDLSEEDIRTILDRHPAILNKSADKNIASKILFFVRALDMSKEELRTIVVRYPSILSYSMNNLRTKLSFFSKLMGYDRGEMRALFVSEPRLLAAAVNTETGLVARFRFLVREMEIPQDKLRKIIQKNPSILLSSLDDNLRPKLIFYFIMTLHMDTKQVVTMLMRFPKILDYNLESTIFPLTRYFVTELEFSPIEVRSIVLKYPRLFSHSLRKIKHVVGYLRYELGMDAAQVKRVLYQAPQAIGLNTDGTLTGKVNYLRDELSLSTEGELQKVLSGMPTLLLCGIASNLEPKIEYLLEAFEDDKDELRQAVVTFPTLLGYSLEKRIRPRMERLKDAGAHASGITIGMPMKDDKYDAWLKNRIVRLRKQPGFDLLQKINSRRRKEMQPPLMDTNDLLPTVPEKAPLSEEERSGRVVHWTRERRQPLD